MHNVSFNIGYKNLAGSTGVLNLRPFLYSFDSIREFTNFIRSSNFELMTWADDNNIPRSSMVIYVVISRYYTEDDVEYVWENDFNIRLSHVREYKEIMKMTDDEIKAHKRSVKINNLITD